MQRQLALQRLQEQEREMQMRFEQQKHMTQIRQMQNYGYPQVIMSCNIYSFMSSMIREINIKISHIIAIQF